VVHEVGERLADHLLRRPAEQAGNRVGDPDHVAGVVTGGHRIGAVLGEQAVPRIHLVLLRDVPRRPVEHHRPVVAALLDAAMVRPDHAAVLGQPPDRHVNDLVNLGLSGPQQDVDVARIEELHAQLGIGVVLGRRVPDQRLHRR
jgi:hypothetical protein